jgi:hypothetical protein
MLQHAGEKAFLLRGGADLARFKAGRGEKPAHSLLVFGNERKCLNRKHFGCFTRGR